MTTAGAHKHTMLRVTQQERAGPPAQTSCQSPVSLSRPHLQNPPRKGREKGQCKGKILPLGLRGKINAPKTYCMERHVPVIPALRGLRQGCKLEVAWNLFIGAS